MGLSGDEREFLQRLLNLPDGTGFAVGARFYAKVHFSTVIRDGEQVVKSLIKRGYGRPSPVFTEDPLAMVITEAGAAVMRAERKAEEAFSKGMAGGKGMYGNAVNRLRAKLQDQRVPTCANKLHKLFSKRTDLTDEEKALLAEMKEALGTKGELPPKGPFKITINGVVSMVPKNVLSYTEIVEAAGLKGNPSMVVHQFSHAQGQKAFELTYGNTIILEQGWATAISVKTTGNA